MTGMPDPFAYTHKESQVDNVDKKKASAFSLVMGLMLLGMPLIILAADCTVHSGAPGRIKIPLQVSKLTVPRDMPTGTVIYQQQINTGAPPSYRLKCPAGGPLPGDFGASYSITPGGGLVGGSLEGVYETGVKGIGVKWTFSADVLTSNREDSLADSSPICGNYGAEGTPAGYCLTAALSKMNDWTRVIVSLIKTGPVGSGVIDGSALGEFQRDVRVEGYTPQFTLQASITGRIDVVSRTCKTPDVNVPMGSYKVSDFRGVGSLVASKNFNIELLDCPGFPGNYRAGAVSSELGVVTAAPLSPNYISIQIDPVIPSLDASEGILALTPGRAAAKGIGLQISRVGNVNGPIILSQLFPAVGVSSGVSATLLADSTTSVPLKFNVAYVQVEEIVTPGKANAVATYTINYQ